MDQQIAAIRAALAAVEAAIAQTQAALITAGTPQDMASLRSVLVDLKAERAKLQLQLASLEAAGVEVQPLGAPRRRARAAAGPAGGAGVGRMAAKRLTQIKALEKELNSAVVDRSVATAAIAFATGVIDKARLLRMIGDDEDPAPFKAAGRTTPARGSAPLPAVRRRRSG